MENTLATNKEQRETLLGGWKSAVALAVQYGVVVARTTTRGFPRNTLLGHLYQRPNIAVRWSGFATQFVDAMRSPLSELSEDRLSVKAHFLKSHVLRPPSSSAGIGSKMANQRLRVEACIGPNSRSAIAEACRGQQRWKWEMQDRQAV